MPHRRALCSPSEVDPRMRITTTTEANTLDDITEEWKIVARRYATGWEWIGELASERQNKLFRDLAFPWDRTQPHFSTITGRDAIGLICVYARIYPMQFRRKGAA